MKYPAKVIVDPKDPNKVRTVRTTTKDATLKVDNKASQKTGQVPLQRMIKTKDGK